MGLDIKKPLLPEFLIPFEVFKTLFYPHSPGWVTDGQMVT